MAAEAAGESLRPASAQRSNTRQMAGAAHRLRRQAGAILLRAVSHGRSVGAADGTAACEPEVVPMDDAVTWYNVPVPGGRLLRAQRAESA